MGYYLHKHGKQRRKILTYLSYVDDDYILKDIDTSMRQLHQILKVNKSIHLSDWPDELTQNRILFSMPKNEEWLAPSDIRIVEEFSRETLEEVEECTRTVEVLVGMNTDFVRRIKGGRARVHDTYASVSRLYHQLGHVVVGRVNMFQIIDGVTCDKCGMSVPREEFKVHEINPACMVETGKRDMVSKGWSRLNGMEDILSIRSCGIDVAMIPEMYGVYVPPWVENALNTYRKGDGYADMTLAEFIQKMKPQ